MDSGAQPGPSGQRHPPPSHGHCTLVDKAGVEAPGVAQEKALQEQGRQ